MRAARAWKIQSAQDAVDPATAWRLRTASAARAVLLFMAPELLPVEIATFIGDHLLSVDEIEALTALSDAPARWWDAKLISGALGVPVSTARGILDHLARLNLLDIRVTDEVRYQFHPGTSTLGRITSRLVSLYRTDPSSVIRAMRSPAS